MAIISCPECGKQVSDRAASCPECGCPISAAAAPAVAPVQNNAQEVEKLLVLARRAREGSDSTNARKYYNQILDKDPGNWEAIFYSVYFEAISCKIMAISSAANSVANCIFSTFSAIADLPSEEDQADALSTVIASACAIASVFVSGAVNHYNQFSTTNNAFSECSNRVVAAGNIYSEIEASLKKVFSNQSERTANFQKMYVNFLNNNSRWYNGTYLNNTKDRLDQEIGKVYPEYLEKRNLEKEIASLNGQINSLVVTRTASLGCLGYFLVPVGIIMLILGIALANIDSDQFWPILVAIPELILGALCLRKKPSQEEVDINLAKRAELIKQREALEEKLKAL